MLKYSQEALTHLTAPARQIKAKVVLFDNSTVIATFTGNDRIQKIEIQRNGESSKFFGFGFCQQLTLVLVDTKRELTNIQSGQKLAVQFGYYNEVETFYQDFLNFYISAVERDEKTNALTITAYDLMDNATKHLVNELELEVPYTIKDFCVACGAIIGATEVIGADEFLVSYPNGANFEGTETIREALTMVAEATQTIYYINYNNDLCFKRLSNATEADITIDNTLFFSATNNGEQRLQTICSATELGDNVSESTTLVGSTQYVRDNAFWELREDIATLVHEAILAVGDLSIVQFECNWRGNYFTEIGDKVKLVARNGEALFTYLLNDTIIYNGGLNQKTFWEYATREETSSNPTSLGEVLKQTYARVDKANQQIQLVASRSESNSQTISQLQDDVASVEKKAELAMTPEQVQIKIAEAMADGVSSVKTETGFTFDSDGLTISKSGSEISTNIDEDGMSIMKNSEEVLTADNTGVNAINLTAHQYLIIGKNSRFEDYQNKRTACFWIGG